MYELVARCLLYASGALSVLWFFGIIVFWGFLELYDNGAWMKDLNKDKDAPAGLFDFIFIAIIGAVVIGFIGSVIVAPFWPVALPLLIFICVVAVVKAKRELQKES